MSELTNSTVQRICAMAVPVIDHKETKEIKLDNQSVFTVARSSRYMENNSPQYHRYMEKYGEIKYVPTGGTIRLDKKRADTALDTGSYRVVEVFGLAAAQALFARAWTLFSSAAALLAFSLAAASSCRLALLASVSTISWLSRTMCLYAGGLSLTSALAAGPLLKRFPTMPRPLSWTAAPSDLFSLVTKPGL